MCSLQHGETGDLPDGTKWSVQLCLPGDDQWTALHELVDGLRTNGYWLKLAFSSEERLVETRQHLYAYAKRKKNGDWKAKTKTIERDLYFRKTDRDQPRPQSRWAALDEQLQLMQPGEVIQETYQSEEDVKKAQAHVGHVRAREGWKLKTKIDGLVLTIRK